MYGCVLSLIVLCIFVLVSWSKFESGPKKRNSSWNLSFLVLEFKSGPSGKKLKPESVLFQVQRYALDSLDNLCWPRRMGMGVISLSYIPWQH